MQIISLWVEGCLTTGMEGIPKKAEHCGDYDVETIPEAVEIYKKTWDEDERHFFSDDNLSCYGCGFYDNEADARKAFG